MVAIINNIDILIDDLSPMKLDYPKMKNSSKGRGEYHYTNSSTEHQPNPTSHKTPCNQARNLREDPGLKGGGMLQA